MAAEPAATRSRTTPREVDDLAALLDTVGGPAFLAAGSGGCGLTLDAASALGDRVAGVYLYEPPFIVDDSRDPAPAGYLAHQEALVAAGRRDEAVEYFMTEMIRVPAEYLPMMKEDPSWREMVRYAHTYAYDGRILAGLQDGTPLPTDRWHIEVPIAVAVGGNGEEFIRRGAAALAALLPNVTVLTLEGQDHSAFWIAPEPVAEQLRAFLRGIAAPSGIEGSGVDAAGAHPEPSTAVAALDRLVGEWTVTGGAEGVVRYEWMSGRHFLMQHVELEQFGERITGLEVIGHLKPFGEPAGSALASRFYDSLGNTLDYTYELEGTPSPSGRARPAARRTSAASSPTGTGCSTVPGSTPAVAVTPRRWCAAERLWRAPRSIRCAPPSCRGIAWSVWPTSRCSPSPRRGTCSLRWTSLRNSSVAGTA
ncbi:alpha/beta fold hydrolase [Tsukamurella sp. PLM1]|uniref:alpha/beta fold hydrolase n=1 Tax=Tsukamurella sp. PLM1 TaxID=2929795 RepID=UPI002062952E|nr:alpha/beta hydrolase [Tsukamurella sp. PLM1]BDH57675.1 hypothetical protein MTP03_26140 [Tsukamurella sp. PLM1]